MKLDTNKLASAVRMALTLGAVATAGLTTAALAQDTGNAAPPPSNKKAQQLETIVVTGSRIRRVDIETANPVFTIDRQTIAQSGALTLGNLVQSSPSIAGAATNPNVNNGGGTGASTVSLRGLGPQRTLVLIDGHRAVNGDVNAIPAALVERVEILKDGASSVYGSDAIGGVVNFILRKNYQGAEFSTNYGISDRSDGARRGFSALIGNSSDKGSIVAGIDYNKYDGVSSNNRAYARNALFLSSTSGVVSSYQGGSSSTPNGYFQLPKGSANAATFGCSAVTKLPGTPGTSLGNYRCFKAGGTPNDLYNYQAVNLITTPQERTNFFVLGNYQLTDNVQAYMDVLHNKTTSNSAVAPLPIFAQNNGITISQYNMYNPFGTNFGAGTTINPVTGKPQSNPDLRIRLVGLGQRMSGFTTTTDQAIAGLRGNFGQTSWQWDANVNYGHFSQAQYATGYINFADLGPALGPSMMVGGVPTCVTTPGNAATAIAGCTPLNIFAANDPAQAATLAKYAANPFYSTTYISKEGSINANGTVFSLPAGDVSLAVGGLYRKEYQQNQVDYIAINNPSTGTCQVGSGCQTPLTGGFNVKEAYAEVLVPILKDVPFAKSLNIDVGSRYSRYSSAGNTTNSKISVEWRPIDDLLVRGTVSQVFRAPAISDLYAGGTTSYPTFTDPCIGYIPGTSPASQNGACGAATGATAIDPVAGIPAPQGNTQVKSIISGASTAGYSLKPEFGKSFDFGFVYDPSWLPGFSTSVDLWRIYLNNTIQNPGAQQLVNICFNNPTSPFCSLIHRNTDGSVNYIQSPTVNLGRLDTSGVDFGFRYRLPQFNVMGVNPGNFAFNFDSTYISSYNVNAAPGVPGDVVIHNAGLYTTAYGSFPRWRAVAGLTWSRGSWDASWRYRYIGNLKIGSPNLAEGLSADASANQPGYVLPIGSVSYSDFSLGYNIVAINTYLQVGVNNAFDKQPPNYYQNNVINANTDVNTYDTLGRYYWGRVTVKF